MACVPPSAAVPLRVPCAGRGAATVAEFGGLLGKKRTHDGHVVSTVPSEGSHKGGGAARGFRPWTRARRRARSGAAARMAAAAKTARPRCRRRAVMARMAMPRTRSLASLTEGLPQRRLRRHSGKESPEEGAGKGRRHEGPPRWVRRARDGGRQQCHHAGGGSCADCNPRRARGGRDDGPGESLGVPVEQHGLGGDAEARGDRQPPHLRAGAGRTADPLMLQSHARQFEMSIPGA